MQLVLCNLGRQSFRGTCSLHSFVALGLLLCGGIWRQSSEGSGEHRCGGRPRVQHCKQALLSAAACTLLCLHPALPAPWPATPPPSTCQWAPGQGKDWPWHAPELCPDGVSEQCKALEERGRWGWNVTCGLWGPICSVVGWGTRRWGAGLLLGWCIGSQLC